VVGIEKRQPQMLVHPQEIDFGRLDAGTQSGHETFVIVNTGDEDLTIFAPDLVSGNIRFAIDQYEQEEYVIAGGDLLEVNVYYTPETYETNGGYISVVGNDEENPSVDVLLMGGGDAPVMTVSPIDFDYGEISIGCDNEERITVRNDGNQDLEIYSVTQMVTQPVDILMEMGSLPEPPWTIVPGNELDFLVSYIPTDIGADSSQIEIAGNDPALPSVITEQYGDGDVEQWFTQTWQQEEIPVLDVLWVIDNSGSMNVFQQNLATNIGSFMSAFTATGADYNMAVITTDRWTFTTILTPQTPNVEQELSNLVVTGIMGSGMERGIQMSYQSLSSATAAGPGGMFFRADATLIVIYVSDEQDWSSPGWSSYINFFDNIKPVGQFIPYGVIADTPSGCTYTYNGYPRTLQPGWGYWDLIDYYGGSWYSICATDWGVQLQDLAGEVTGRRMFELDEPDPIETTIEVTVNGQVTTDWTYDSGVNAVVFNEGHVPEEGQTIEINYAVWGCGE
tara:strand:- start:1279 stop:2796 length:1518 start_codon:yes stop_codon:yes gene_type:complete